MEIVFKDVKNPKLTLAMDRQEIKIPLNMADDVEMINRIKSLSEQIYSSSLNESYTRRGIFFLEPDGKLGITMSIGNKKLDRKIFKEIN